MTGIGALKRSVGLAMLLVAVMGAPGCGDADRGPAAPAESVLHRGTGDEPESLDVHKAGTTEAGDVLRDIGEGLVGYTRDGQLAPAAAERWELSDDGREYRFFIREGARWSNGDPLLAEDFVYSFRRLVDPATAALHAQSLADVVNAGAIIAGDMTPDTLGVEAVDERQLVLRLDRPVPYLLGLLTHPSAFPVHRGAVETHGDLHARPGNLVGNGAYRLVDWQIGSYIEIERNVHYWNNDATSIDRVLHHVTPQPVAELNRYRAGELHVTRTIPPGSFAQMREERPDELRVSPALSIYYYGFNLTRTPFADNPGLREALSLAIDREVLTGQVIGRGEAPAYSWVPPGIEGYEPRELDYATQTQEARNRKARQLYREAGYDEENPLRFELRYNTSNTQESIASAIRSMWQDVLGAEAVLVNEEFQVLVANARQKEVTEVFRLSWVGDYGDPHAFLHIFESDNPSNFTGYHSDEYDSLMASAAEQRDPDLRRAFLEEAERLVLSDHAVIPIYFYINKSMVNPRVRGWGDNVLNYHYSQHLSLAADPL